MRLSHIRRALSVLSTAEKRRCGLIVCLNVAGAMLELALVGAIPLCVAVLSDRTKIDSFPLEELGIQHHSASDAELLFWMTAGIVALAAMKLGYFFVVHRYTLRTVRAMRVRLSRDVFDSCLYARWNFHLQNNSAGLLRNCTSEISEYTNGVIIAGLGVLHGVIVLVAVVLLVIAILPFVAIIALLLTLGSVGGLMLWLRKWLTHAGETSRRERMQMLSHVQEGLGNLVDARLSGKENWFLDRYIRSAAQFSGSQFKIAFVSRLLPYTVEFVSLLGLTVVVTLLARDAGSASAAAVQITGIAVGLVRLRQAASQVAANAARFQFSLPSVESITEHTIKLEKEPVGSHTAEEFRFEHAIRLENLQYSYGTSKKPVPVLDGLCVTIQRGACVALIGETGCGKSTVLQLILGLLEPDEGKICVDGVDIRTNLRAWRSRIGYVPQRIQLLDASIRENIALAEDEIDETRLRQAIDIAQLQSVIAAQPDCLNTVIGENGARLSGGQRQRLGLARALYRQPSVIILDEATSALDHETEAAITSSLNSIPWTATRILVAHRLSTVKDCDSVIILRNGVVNDVGRFDELRQRHTSLVSTRG